MCGHIWLIGNGKQIGIEDVLQYMDEHFDPNTELNCRPLITALSKMNTAVAPEPLTKSTPCGLSDGIGFVNTL